MLPAWILRRALGLALVLAVPLGGGELLARTLIGDAVTSAVRSQIGGTAHVSLGSSPVLLQLIHGHLDRATVNARGARIGGIEPVMLTATLRDLRLTRVTSLQGAIGSVAVDARLGPAPVGRLLDTPGCAGALPAALRRALTSAPIVVLAPGAVELRPPGGGGTAVRLRAAAAGEAVAFEVAGVERHGAWAGRSRVGAIAARLHCGRALSSLPFGLSLVSATVSAGAVELAFSGRDAVFSALG